MLKKAGHIAIIILLLIATGGLPVTRHYCGRVQKSVSFYTTPKSCCGEGCDKCHNVFKFTKVNDNFQAGSTVHTQPLADVIVIHTTFYIDSFTGFDIPVVSDLVNQRTAYVSKAGHSPARIGNFRC